MSRWHNHENHREIIEEIYANCKYLLTEQAKDSLLDAIDCMKIADRLEQADVHHHLDKIIELRTSPFTKDGDYHYIDGYNQALADIRGEEK